MNATRDRIALADFTRQVGLALGSRLIDLRLFGSKATGQDAPDSDIDILVLVRKADLNLEDAVLDIAFGVNLKHDVYISPRVIGEATLRDPVWRETAFVQTLLKDAVVL